MLRAMENGSGPIARLVMGLGGAALVASLFVTWYSLSLADILHGLASQMPSGLSGQFSSAAAAAYPTLTWSGWNAVHLIRLVVAVVGLAALLASVASPAAVGNRLLVPAGGLFAAVLAAHRIQTPPASLGISVGPFDLQTPTGAAASISSLLRVELGGWVALTGGLLVFVGGLLALADARAAQAVASPMAPGGPSGGATAEIWTL